MNIKDFFMSWVVLFLSVFFNVFGVFAIKQKMNTLGPFKADSIKEAFNYFFILLSSKIVIAGLVLFFIDPFLFAVALSRMDITVAYPVQIVLNLVFLLIIAVVFLGETITINKALAVVFAFITIYLLTRK